MHSRFRKLDKYGDKDLESLQNSTAAVVGLGATGSVIAEHLARHGVNLILIDRDYLEENDLYSSNIYTRSDTERAVPKARAIGERLSDLAEVDYHVEDLDSKNIEILDEADIVMDGTDNLETRLLISEYCQREGEPWIYTAAIGERGFSMFFDENCFNCLFEQISASNLETCETAGIMREISSMAASVSSIKAIRYLTGKEVEEKLDAVHSGKSFRFESEGCGVCENQNFDRLESGSSVTKLCGESKFQIKVNLTEKSLERFKENFDPNKENNYLLQTEIEGDKFTVFKSGRVIVEAEDEGRARQKVSELIGV